MPGLVLLFQDQELPLDGQRVLIGRRDDCTLQIKDLSVSGHHAIISNGMLWDNGSTNGTELNNKPLKKNERVRVKAGDVVKCGDSAIKIESQSSQNQQKFNQSKRFPQGVGKDASKPEAKKPEAKKEEKEKEKEKPESKDKDEKESLLSVPELMDQEFSRIIGHDNIKTQLRQFYKKVQLDTIRAKNGKTSNEPALYHMIFSGPPGTGKTTLANLVAKIMLKMGLVQSDNVVFVNNALELLGQYVGQTPEKVDKKVEEARGGVIFIDEAYSVVQEGKAGSFGKEAIDTMMKHMLPPTCVFIFAGYEKPMEDFLAVNSGLARRIPYRYNFNPYSTDELIQIFQVMCTSKGEILDEGLEDMLRGYLEDIPTSQRESQNGGVVSNWLSFAQIERDDRIDLDEAIRNPMVASLLTALDLERALVKVKTMV